ncbi:WXG100 family type VII secretion target [Nocardia asteroides]|uniref:WXG100 family type VII secretion target n=1 Tax=Nocardia asteroides TaxID=1824 RepID=UPI001E379F2D|nr:WXG100 family type VII secretion target [Nocardia asteroides]UGT59408.1 WXG100 family type VII secretion target [Nocardia asteroides]
MADHDGFAVVPEEVAAVGRFAYRIATELRDGANSLDREVSMLMNSWRGAAAQSYEAGWGDMHAGAVRVWEELLQLAEKLGVTAENYRAQEDESGACMNLLNLDVP